MAHESGQVMLLIIGFAVMLGLLVTVVVDVSHLYLERRALVAAADAGALAAAQAIDESALYTGGAVAAGESLRLDDQAIDQRLLDQIRAAGLDDRFSELQVDRVSSDGVSVTVELSARVRLPFLNAVTADTDGLRIAASARAQTAVALE
jgi:Flp pilus assembly protein TadG